MPTGADALTLNAALVAEAQAGGGARPACTVTAALTVRSRRRWRRRGPRSRWSSRRTIWSLTWTERPLAEPRRVGPHRGGAKRDAVQGDLRRGLARRDRHGRGLRRHHAGGVRRDRHHDAADAGRRAEREGQRVRQGEPDEVRPRDVKRDGLGHRGQRDPDRHQPAGRRAIADLAEGVPVPAPDRRPPCARPTCTRSVPSQGARPEHPQAGAAIGELLFAPVPRDRRWCRCRTRPPPKHRGRRSDRRRR